MNTIIIDFINNYGYIAIALLIAVENIFPPIPSEVILTFGGFLSLSANLNIGGLIVASTIGALIGAIVLYLFGKLISFEHIEKLVNGKWGKILHLKIEHIEKAQRFFTKHGGSAVFWGRFLPVIRSLISIPAGMAEYSFKKFLLLTGLGSAIWNTALILVGHFAGSSWEKLSNTIEQYSIVVLFIVIIVGIIGYFIYRHFHNKKSAN
ncbi:DedA family protein [Ligilactobacillus cholophilus]|uniref:DedA family protein n=1 Tax=Ligilactobacillus cholophilus TaxID=3050131 RepID=UPI0025B22E55|nr:DedA family protein [Ligilactobacillus cholophilus]